MTDQTLDIIHIKNIEAKTKIGIYPHEKLSTQPVMVDLKIFTNIKSASFSKDIKDTHDYAEIAKFIINYLATSEILLLETLAENLAAVLLQEFQLRKVTLTITKLWALRDLTPNANVSLTITRNANIYY